MQNNIYFKEFTNEKILVLSDTHIGSKYEELQLLYDIRKYIEDNKIKTVIHAGDIGDGMVNYSKKYPTYANQIEHILKYYNLGSVKQYILGGNHDKKYKKHSIDLLKLLACENVEPLGYYQAYFKIYNKVVSLEHNSRILNEKIIKPDLRLLGHAHEFLVKDNIVKIPPACYEIPNQTTEDYNIGFITLNPINVSDKLTIEIERFGYNNNQISVTKTKKLVIN